MYEIVKKMSVVVLAIGFLIVTGCGSKMNSAKTINNSDESSESLGQGIYSASVSDIVSSGEMKDLKDITDEELIADHISSLESMLEDLESGTGPKLPDDVEFDKAVLVADLKERIRKLKEDDTFKTQVIKEIRAVLSGTMELPKEILNDENFSKEIEGAPEAVVDTPMDKDFELNEEVEFVIDCDIFKEILNDENFPKELRVKEEARYKETCS